MEGLVLSGKARLMFVRFLSTTIINLLNLFGRSGEHTCLNIPEVVSDAADTEIIRKHTHTYKSLQDWACICYPEVVAHSNNVWTCKWRLSGFYVDCSIVRTTTQREHA